VYAVERRSAKTGSERGNDILTRAGEGGRDGGRDGGREGGVSPQPPEIPPVSAFLSASS